MKKITGTEKSLKELGKGEEDCIKTWLSAKYAQSIRENKKNAAPEDFNLIGVLVKALWSPDFADIASATQG